MNQEARHYFEFGAFRLDPDKRLLSRGNEPVPLQPKAFETLLVLVQNCENVVLKDDLMKTLWPGRYVEESNLTQHIFMLRKTLGETAGENRYIATVPGRGYRFAERVRRVPHADEILMSSHSVTRVVVNRRTSPNRAWGLAAAAVLLLAVVIGGVWSWSSHRAPKLTEKDTIVVADFANTTGDAVFDGALRRGLSAQLEQSPFLNLLSDQRVVQTLSLMGQPQDARLTEAVAREICQRAAAAAVLDPSIAQVGARYLLTLRALDCSSGEPIASATAEAIDKNHVLEALGIIAAETRRKLGESMASVQKYDVPPEQVTTPSLEALKAYTLAMKARNTPAHDFALTRQFFQRAIDLDPQFAMAYAQLGVIYINLGQAVRGEENIRKAYQLRTRVSERERFYIASHYDENVTGDLEAARKDIEVWAQLYPRDPVPWANLNVVYLFLGDYDKVLTTTQTAVDLSGVKELSTNLVWAYIFVNRIDEAKALVEPAARSTDGPLYHLNLYMIDFLKHDTDGMRREAAAASSNTTWGHIALNYESDTAAYFGQFANARDFTRHAVDAAEKSDNPESAASYETDAALREALVGNMASATEYANAALALSNGKDVQAQAAFALSLAGNPAQAARMAADLAGRFPQEKPVADIRTSSPSGKTPTRMFRS